MKSKKEINEMVKVIVNKACENANHNFDELTIQEQKELVRKIRKELKKQFN